MNYASSPYIGYPEPRYFIRTRGRGGKTFMLPPDCICERAAVAGQYQYVEAARSGVLLSKRRSLRWELAGLLVRVGMRCVPDYAEPCFNAVVVSRVVSVGRIERTIIPSTAGGFERQLPQEVLDDLSPVSWFSYGRYIRDEGRTVLVDSYSFDPKGDGSC